MMAALNCYVIFYLISLNILPVFAEIHPANVTLYTEDGEPIDANDFISRSKLNLRLTYNGITISASLERDLSTAEINVPVIIHSNGESRTENAHYELGRWFTGSVDDESGSSSVTGILHHEGFSGKVLIEDEELTVQPAQSTEGNSIVSTSFDTRDENPHTRTKRKTNRAPEFYHTCHVLFIADYYFFKEVGNSDIRWTLDILFGMFDESAFYLSNLFFKREHLQPYDFTIYPRSVEIMTTMEWVRDLLPTQHHKKIINAKDLLHELSQHDFKNYCAVIFVTARDFEKQVLSISWQGDFEPNGHVGGICQVFKVHGKISSYNTMAVTVKLNGKIVPSKLARNALTHGLGHLLGARHDFDCPWEGVGNEMDLPYVMSDHAVIQDFDHGKVFSECSRLSITRFLLTKGSCLEEAKHLTCGNGIIERSVQETCDCGTPEMCKKIDPCCTPPGGFPNDRENTPCTIRKGAVCSPSTSDCCLPNCQISPKLTNQTCNSDGYDDECIEGGRCNGVTAYCPDPEFLDGKACMQGTCFQGKCHSDPCAILGLKPCICTDNYECLVCCMTAIEETCDPIYSLGIRSADDNPIGRPTGHPCGQDGNFMCGRRWACVSRALFSDNQYPFALHFLIIGIVVLAYMTCKTLSLCMDRHHTASTETLY